MNTLRLCIVANPTSIHTRRWVEYFVQRGHEVTLIGDQPLQRPAPAGVRYVDLPGEGGGGKLRYLRWARTVRRIVHDLRPDVLHAHYVASAGWLGAAAGYHPFLVTAWGSDLLVNAQQSAVQRQLTRWVLRRADYVTCVSEHLAQVARQLGGREGRVETAPWGVDTAIFRPAVDQQALRRQLGLDAGPVVMSIRSVKPLYNPQVIAQAIPLVLHVAPATRFVVRTHSSDEDALAAFRQQVDAAGVSHAVRYVGEQRDDRAIAEGYAAADIAVSVPSSDGAPLSVLEAMACGVVPVLSDLPSLREWVRDDEEGLLVPVGDAPALAAAILRLIADDALRDRLRAGSLAVIQARGDRARLMQRAEQIYHDLAAGRLPQPAASSPEQDA